MFTNVLVGVDGGANGRDAIALARQLADPEGKITLAHVHRGDLDPLIAMGRGLLKAEREASSRLLVDERLATGVEAELREVIALSAGAGLHGQAESQGADLLVVGSSRHGALGRALLGDNARAALNGAPCAVAIASHGYAHEQAKLATIGVAYDGSPESKAALQAVRTVAAKTGAEVQLRQVVFIPSMSYSGPIPVHLGEGIQEMVKQGERRVGEITGVAGKAVYGSPREELEAFSDGVDLLAVGSRSYGPVKRLMFGSTANYLARHAGCSLLVLPRGVNQQDATPSADAKHEPGVGVAG
ncbi:MAG TPA: universal stress protein [Solirubrobacteraceae bacterium]|nr:universal stress protein [Solirubrobacteraceae bacterium]